MVQVFRWDGRYFGFFFSNYLFDAESRYMGWVEDGKVWSRDGYFLGEIVEENYILKQNSMMEPLPRIPIIPPVPPVPPIRSMNRPGRMARLGWVDALDVLR